MRPRRALPAEGALDLAVLRITVALVLLTTGLVYESLRWSRLPNELRVPPYGFGWIATHVPIDERTASFALGVFLANCVSGLFGFQTRWSFGLVTVVGVYLLGIPQLSGTAQHVHHLLWLSALLAVSPCDDALSLASFRGPARTYAPSPAYGVPLTFARVLIAFVFFFPGVWKLRESGLAWVTGDNLRNLMWLKWFQAGALPLLRIDRSAALCHALAACAVVFELAFLPLVSFRKARPLLVACALAFHLFTGVFLHIHFSALWWCYVVFIDWSAVARRLAPGPLGSGATEPITPVVRRRAGAPVMVVGIGLLVGAAWCGARGIVQGWPFACYPTFQYLAPPEIMAIELEAVRADGSVVAVPPASALDRRRGQLLWALEWTLLARQPADEQAVRGYLALVASMSPEAAIELHDARTVRVHRVWYSTAPDDWARPALRRVLALELTPAAAGPS